MRWLLEVAIDMFKSAVITALLKRRGASEAYAKALTPRILRWLDETIDIGQAVMAAGKSAEQAAETAEVLVFRRDDPERKRTLEDLKSENLPNV